MEARFVGEDVAEIGPCRFTVHRCVTTGLVAT
jgi:hypothetical protein